MDRTGNYPGKRSNSESQSKYHVFLSYVDLRVQKYMKVKRGQLWMWKRKRKRGRGRTKSNTGSEYDQGMYMHIGKCQMKPITLE